MVRHTLKILQKMSDHVNVNEFVLVSLLLLWTDFTHCSGVSIVDHEQVNGSWGTSLTKE